MDIGRWMQENESKDSYKILEDCWDLTGHHPERAPFSAELQCLIMTEYAHSTIECDGFYTYFKLPIADAAPEVALTLEMLGFPVCANAMLQAMALVSPNYYARQASVRIQQLELVRDKLSALDAKFSLGADYSVFFATLENRFALALEIQ